MPKIHIRLKGNEAYCGKRKGVGFSHFKNLQLVTHKPGESLTNHCAKCIQAYNAAMSKLPGSKYKPLDIENETMYGSIEPVGQFIFIGAPYYDSNQQIHLNLKHAEALLKWLPSAIEELKNLPCKECGRSK